MKQEIFKSFYVCVCEDSRCVLFSTSEDEITDFSDMECSDAHFERVELKDVEKDMAEMFKRSDVSDDGA